MSRNEVAGAVHKVAGELAARPSVSWRRERGR
jgi:hypothetical protein